MSANGYNYEFHLKHEDGRTNKLGYQFLIDKLGIADTECHGQPMSAGGAPQAMSLKGIIERVYEGVSVEVWFNGGQIF